MKNEFNRERIHIPPHPEERRQARFEGWQRELTLAILRDAAHEGACSRLRLPDRLISEASEISRFLRTRGVWL
jgi:hypothetical protein